MDVEKSCLECDSLTIKYSFLYPETVSYFKEYLTPSDGAADLEIQITPAYMEENRWLVDESEQCQPFIEFHCLMLATGNALLAYQRALFHGVAILWRGKAWILTAPSGTGKTTQLRHWLRLQRKEIQVINGDKPLLECRKDGSVWVHSSPWKGKEGIGRKGLSASLGGIILLEQGQENQIRRMDPPEAVIPLYTEFVSYPENPNQIRDQARILRQMLEFAPVWKLVNLGNEESAHMTHSVLADWLEENHE